ncbi:MAG: LysR family transcriptional regulator [Betaproteobacteria bacterium]|nr:LysR family transcriptional regulator [Betaproteobacteria bacterium]
MDSMDIRLLMVFDAIYKTRSVTAAAEVLDLGQPAVSVALAKLRHHFGNPLFVRTSNGMEPTPFSEGLVQPVYEVLGALEKVLGHRGEFDPGGSERSFRICMTDISQLVLLPRLWEVLRETAPGVCIEIIPMTSDTARLLESGEADLAVGFIPQLEAGFHQQTLFLQSFVCMVGRDHPRIGDSLDRAQFEAEDHAVVSSSGAAPAMLEREIARLGIQRRIALKISSFLSAAFVVEHTDLLLTIPQRLGEVLQGRGSFRILPVPFPLPDYDVKQHWHERYHHDEGNRWLRRVVARLLSAAS